MARWDRAAAWLPPDAWTVLDVGCAFGYGTARLARATRRKNRRSDRKPLVVGVELDPDYARQAARNRAGVHVVRGSAAALPFADASFDALTILDVLEHLPSDRAAVEEARRVPRVGGALIVSVPHRGLLAGLDSLNLYERLRSRWRWLSPLHPTEGGNTDGRGRAWHRHYSLAELGALLGEGWSLDRVTTTGLGIAEMVNLGLLLVCRGLLRSERAYGAAKYLYYTTYLLEDLLPLGRHGYNLTIRAIRT